MTKPPTILTRRSIFRAGVGVAVAATATPLLTASSVRAERAGQADAEAVNGDGFYRFKICDFEATVISDGCGQLPIGPSIGPAAAVLILGTLMLVTAWVITLLGESVWPPIRTVT